jgi:hypothetical protein
MAGHASDWPPELSTPYPSPLMASTVKWLQCSTGTLQTVAWCKQKAVYYRPSVCWNTVRHIPGQLRDNEQVCLNCRHSYVTRRLWPPAYWLTMLHTAGVWMSVQKAKRSTAFRLTSLLLKCDVCQPAVFSIWTNKLSHFQSNTAVYLMWLSYMFRSQFGPSSDYCMTL